MVIGGNAVDAISGKTFETENPYTGRVWATVPDAGPADVDAAVAAAREAFEGPWRATTGFQRAALMHRFADQIDENAEWLARLEVSDSGKLLREMSGQMKGLGSWYRYHAGLADKLEGRPIPTPNPNYIVYTKRVPVGVVGGDHAVELAAAADDLEARTGARRRLHGRGQTVRTRAGGRRSVRAAGHPGRLPHGVFNVVCGSEPRCRRGAGRASRRRQGRIHRLHQHWSRGGHAADAEPEPGHPRTRR